MTPMSATYEELLRTFGDAWFSSFELASQKLLLTQGVRFMSNAESSMSAGAML